MDHKTKQNIINQLNDASISLRGYSALIEDFEDIREAWVDFGMALSASRSTPMDMCDESSTKPLRSINPTDPTPQSTDAFEKAMEILQ